MPLAPHSYRRSTPRNLSTQRSPMRPLTPYILRLAITACYAKILSCLDHSSPGALINPNSCCCCRRHCRRRTHYSHRSLSKPPCRMHAGLRWPHAGCGPASPWLGAPPPVGGKATTHRACLSESQCVFIDGLSPRHQSDFWLYEELQVKSSVQQQCGPSAT